MYFFYLIPTLCFIAGAIAWVRSKRIMFWEWMVGSLAGFAIAGIYHWLVIRGMTADVETWSGQVVEARDYKPWLEYYEYAVYRTETRTGTRSVSDSKGRSHTETYTYTVEVFDHWASSSRQHAESWGYVDSLGGSGGIDLAIYTDIISRFGGEGETPGVRTTSDHNSRMISGDPNDRVSLNKNSFVKPITTWRTWVNKVKSAPTVFSFEKISPETPVFDYPKNDNVFASDRLLGTAASIPLLAWDQMNARLGPTKHVNVIAVGFGEKDSSFAQKQRSKWIGGKKNDLVICYGGPNPTKASWAQCFGWTEEEICKRNIETIFISNPVNAAIIPKLEAEIAKNYKIKDWSQFDYLTVEPPTWSYWVFFLVMVVTQGGMWFFFVVNEVDKEDPKKGANPYANRWNTKPSTPKRELNIDDMLTKFDEAKENFSDQTEKHDDNYMLVKPVDDLSLNDRERAILNQNRRLMKKTGSSPYVD